ncbi:MAG: nucleotidyltransferase domain-containing protein [Lachnospiraceae bacterium]|nr:nucleotidyltransferase domain-containing protein [Lachnospiraceae bacterium]
MLNIDLLPFSKEIKTRLRKLTDIACAVPDVTKVILFGSYARAEYKVGSDLDILIMTDCEVPRDLRGDVSSLFETMGADVVFYTEDCFSNSDCMFVNQIRKDGVLLWKRD